MKKAILAFWIIGAILLIGTRAFAEGNPQPGLPFPDPALIGRPPVVQPYVNRPTMQPQVQPYLPGNQPIPGMPVVPGMPPIAGQPIVPNVRYVEPEFVSFIKKLEAIPENKIDIGTVALTLAKDVYPDLDVKAYSRRIDKIAGEIKKITNGSNDPDWRIRVMNSYLYRQVGIHYAYDDPCAEKKEHRYITGILDYKEGCCVSMPTFYMAVGQRLGYPIYPVSAPQHVFLRYVDPKFKEQNIEATEGGGYSPDDNYRKDLEVSAKALKSGAYLRTLSHREFLGYLISQPVFIGWEKGIPTGPPII
jgi:regulator of sirC expression with transglutaminase-like and TPR domain